MVYLPEIKFISTGLQIFLKGTAFYRIKSDIARTFTFHSITEKMRKIWAAPIFFQARLSNAAAIVSLPEII